MTCDRELYVRSHRTLYDNFGRISGYAEALAVVFTGALAWQADKQHLPDASHVKAAAVCLAAAHAIFWGLFEPVNKRMLRWDLNAIPPDWKKCRNQWEYSHVARAVLVTGALSALVLGAVRNPSE